MPADLILPVSHQLETSALETSVIAEEGWAEADRRSQDETASLLQQSCTPECTEELKTWHRSGHTMGMAVVSNTGQVKIHRIFRIFRILEAGMTEKE